MVVINRFVKIYDLLQDNISFLYYFTLLDYIIMDVVFFVVFQGKIYFIVFLESGSLYKFELLMEVNVGIKQFNEKVEILDKNVYVKGLFLYFFSIYKLFFVLYQDGSIVIGRLNFNVIFLIEILVVYEEEYGK